MKKLLSLNLLIALAVVFASCGTNNNVVNNRLISKRKYNKGFHFNKKGNMKSSKVEKEEGESIAFEDVKSVEKKAKKTTNVSNRVEDKNADMVVPKSENDANATESSQAYKPVFGKSLDAPVRGEESTFNEAHPQEDFETDNETSSSEQTISKKELKKKARSSARGGNSDLLNILLIVLLVLVILALISLIGGTLGWILSVLVLVVIIYFLLKLLGAF